MRERWSVGVTTLSLFVSVFRSNTRFCHLPTGNVYQCFFIVMTERKSQGFLGYFETRRVCLKGTICKGGLRRSRLSFMHHLRIISHPLSLSTYLMPVPTKKLHTVLAPNRPYQIASNHARLSRLSTPMQNRTKTFYRRARRSESRCVYHPDNAP